MGVYQKRKRSKSPVHKATGGEHQPLNFAILMQAFTVQILVLDPSFFFPDIAGHFLDRGWPAIFLGIS